MKPTIVSWLVKELIKFLKNRATYVAAAVFTTILVVVVLLYSNFKIIDVLSYFEKLEPYQNQIVYFYGDGCSQCDKVDAYLAANKVEDKVSFVRLEVFDDLHNQHILSDRAQVCGIDPHNLGVPFIWEGPQRRCILGYLDVIDFFKQKMKLAPVIAPKP